MKIIDTRIIQTSDMIVFVAKVMRKMRHIILFI